MPGLHFYKLDLHVHTPKSKCYLQKENTAEQIVQAAIEKGLDGIAITDHNTAEFISQIQAAARGKPLVIFPGVEISLEAGYHLVALFDPSCDQRHVESFLGAIDITPEQYGKSESFSRKSVHDVISKIHERNGLAIFAHIDLPKGAFKEQIQTLEDGRVRVPINCSGLFNDPSYDAIECSNGALPNGYDSQHQLKRFPAIYQSSDNPDTAQPTKHSLDGIGSRHSWFKLDQIDIEGLRQCFADPEVRIRLMGMHQEVGYPKITSMRIGGTGFLRNQHFDFHEGLNCLIGGKGVGKSLAIEMLRFALDQAPKSDDNLLDDHIKKLEKRLESGNSVEVIYCVADGTQYKLTRSFNGRRGAKSLEYDSTLTCTNLSTGDEFEGEISRLFPILAYSQTEVIKIAEDKNAQLQLMDRFIDTRQVEIEIGSVQAKLQENDVALNQAIHARGQLDTCQRDIRTLKEQISQINQSLANPIFDSYKAAEGKKAVFTSKTEYVEDLIALVRQWQVDLGNQSLDEIPDNLVGDPLIQTAQADCAQAKNLVSQALSSVIPQIISIKEKIFDSYESWLPEFDQVSHDYAALLVEIGGNREAKERERKRLERQLEAREKEERGLRKLSDNLTELLSNRNTLLDQLERNYRQYYDIRREKYDELTALSDGKLQLILDHAADRTKYEANLSELLKGGQNAPSVVDRAKIANGIMPRRLVQLILDRNDAHLAAESELTEGWAKKVVEKLWSTDDFTKALALQHNCFPTDVPSIRFRKEGGIYDDLTELSIGQKCTALLIIALCDGTMPIVIDQPEDALDIISVWEDISKKLRRGKNSRQFILTTHNSSVAVASDSDQFIVLVAGASTGRVVYTGAIDRPDIKKAVIDILEGGEVPYILRSKKYNIQSEQK